MDMNEGLPKRVARAIISAFLSKRQKRQMHLTSADRALEVNLVTSWDKQCGIATYSAYFAHELKKKCKVYVTVLTNKNALSPYFGNLGYTVGRSYDLVHVQFEYGIFPSLKLGKRTLTAFSALLFYLGLAMGNRYVVTTLHEPRKTVTAGSRSGLLYSKQLDQLLFSVSDTIVVHTQESKRLLQTVYGLEPTKLTVIPHGSYEQPKFSDKEAAKAKLGLQGKIIVTILGFVTAKKGHDLVIPLLPKINDNVQLVIAGGPQNYQDEQYMANLKKLAEQYGVSDRVTLTGYLEDLTSILNASDVALLPYRYVTDSGVLHLLIAYRVPTLTSDLAAFREVYDEFGCLDLFRAGDSEDLYEKLRALLADSQHRITLKAKCADMWNATKWSTIAQRHIELYRQILSKKS
jgi:glycosyltransferase involved in cell wall biosynthesis